MFYSIDTEISKKYPKLKYADVIFYFKVTPKI